MNVFEFRRLLIYNLYNVLSLVVVLFCTTCFYVTYKTLSLTNGLAYLISVTSTNMVCCGIDDLYKNMVDEELFSFSENGTVEPNAVPGRILLLCLMVWCTMNYIS